MKGKVIKEYEYSGVSLPGGWYLLRIINPWGEVERFWERPTMKECFDLMEQAGFKGYDN